MLKIRRCYSMLNMRERITWVKNGESQQVLFSRAAISFLKKCILSSFFKKFKGVMVS